MSDGKDKEKVCPMCAKPIFITVSTCQRRHLMTPGGLPCHCLLPIGHKIEDCLVDWQGNLYWVSRLETYDPNYHVPRKAK